MISGGGAGWVAKKWVNWSMKVIAGSRVGKAANKLRRGERGKEQIEREGDFVIFKI